MTRNTTSQSNRSQSRRGQPALLPVGVGAGGILTDRGKTMSIYSDAMIRNDREHAERHEANGKRSIKTAPNKLSPSRLYFGDNGRLFCGELRCAGMTACMTGRDLSGQKVEILQPEDVAYFDSINLTAKCESCGKEGSRIAVTS